MATVREVKEKVEKGVYKVKEEGAHKVAGERSLSLGELVCTVVGAALIVYGAFKLDGKKRQWAVGGGLALILAGELVW